MGILEPFLQSVFDVGTNVVNWMSQRETNALNEKLMRESWARDDSAMQRRVADLQKAGLNPVLAAGGSGASNSGPIRISAPEFSGLDISKAYAASIAGTQNQMVKSQAARAASEATAAEIGVNKLAAETKLSIANAEAMFPYSEGIAKATAEMINNNAAKAEGDAMAAVAEAQIKIHDQKILDKNPELLSTSTGTLRDIMGGVGILGSLLDKVGKYQFKGEVAPK